MGGGSKKTVEEPQLPPVAQMSEKEKAMEAKVWQEKQVEERKRLQVVERKVKKDTEGELEREMKQIRKIELTYEKEQLTKETNDLINNFDEEIKEMQREKYRLESDLKNAEMKLIMYFEELILLKSMEGKDQELTKRLAKCR
mmetsp:Transcript_1195/g.1221  ORF Transcript_1195/g.1221 Transcript_1195/m.1221 type:complete len:142 (-) Transcript_1195:1428-1853(-)